MLDFLTSLNLLEILGAATALVSGLLAVALVVPGEQPDKFLKGALNLLKKFSKK